MTHTQDPGAAHQAFMRKLDDAEKEMRGALPPMHRVAIVAQFLGQLIGEVPDDYAPGEIMRAVALNIEAGNKATAGALITL